MTEQSPAMVKQQRIFDSFWAPLTLYGLLFGLYSGFNRGSFSWYTWHPLTMMLGFVTLAGNAALIKKVKGLENTRKHSNWMLIAIAITLFGWYVIYDIKEERKKQHLKSWHGKVGAGVMIGYLAVGIFGAIALNPDFGLLKTNQTVRVAHKWAGRVLTLAAWWCCVTGFVPKNPELWKQLLFILPLLIAGPYILL